MLCTKNLKLEPLSVEGLSPEENRSAELFMEQLLIEWQGTPYSSGKFHKGRGVDCVHFITAIYDSLLGTQYLYDTLPQDISFHCKDGAEAGLHRFFRQYPSNPVEGDTLQPGDIVICGPVGKHGGPGHGMIAGPTGLWHVDAKNVCKTGLGILQAGSGAFKQIRRLADRSIFKACAEKYNHTVSEAGL